ncbi:NAD(P)/FAD-dependent oxidoreductase [Gillisia sp. CAL575]|uniref:NAD(P)/FAD-dependent oxidoreductase n=1 Tax=Gillisia sp. CAL575 TaxID=985255 RepID=UPI000399F286|nr:NAD(P)/FAD-dependent oxidoreductase [Gillisia sp. CAL575]
MKKKSIGIVGGGLSGLVAAIHLSRNNFPVTVFEKDSYPNHKVCGEYVSIEIVPYLKQLDINLSDLKPALIDKLQFSDVTGKTVNTKLPLGGLGISRYALDEFLYLKALASGVNFIHALVTDVTYTNDEFAITTNKNEPFEFKIVLGAYGKRSLLDKKLDRQFIDQKSGWLAIKGHYKKDGFPDNLVMLHNFKGGYCGLSKTETGAINVCYLASYNSFKKHKDPVNFKNEVLMQNPHLRDFFQEATPLFEKNLSIAQISFDKKSSIQDHILMLGDAAGLIHPLSGNGMAMAIHSAKIASEVILKYYENETYTREAMEKEYEKNWKEQFSSRLRMGNILQNILLNPQLSNIVQKIISSFPSLLPKIISKTHGNPIL